MSTIFQNPPLLLNEKEAAHVLNCCEKTVYRMRLQGRIPFMRLGNAIRYPRTELVKFIENQSKTVDENSPKRS